MSSTNMRRDEALERAHHVSVQAYHVQVDLRGLHPSGEPLADPDNTFVSVSTISFTSDGTPTWVDLIADAVLMVELDGDLLPEDRFDGTRYPVEVGPGEHELVIFALCRFSHTGEGLHRFVDPADGRVYLYSQFESADARRMYACFEQPNLKAVFTFAVIAPKGWTVISNSGEVEIVEMDAGHDAWNFAPIGPISTYITALIAGEYHVTPGSITSVKGEIPARLLCRQSVVEHLDSQRLFTTTQRGFTVFEAEFDSAYPFDSYDQIFVPEFNFGAMENAGCVTIRDEYLFRSRVTAAAYEGRDNTILHELAHMWFGDLVTMTWWDDLWLNESFAEWASHYAQQRIVAQYGGVDPWVSFANARKGWAYRQDQLPSTHPIAADMVDLRAVEQNFDGITYAKGASALRQLVAFVGEPNFLAGVRTYFARHAWGNTQLNDLLTALTEASGRDLSSFSSEWLERSGVNTMAVDAEIDDESRFTSFDVIQVAPEMWPTLRTHRMGIGLYRMQGDTLVRTELFEVDVSGPRTSLPELIGVTQPDLLLLNDGDLTYTKVRLDTRSLETLINHIDAVHDPLTRAVLWQSAWDMCRDAEMAGSDFVDLVLRGIGGETDLTAVGTLLRQAAQAAVAYTHHEARSTVRGRLVTGLVDLLKHASAGSDHQLAFANALVDAVHTPVGAEVLAAWLTGDEVPSGLAIDTDMRWRIITALARMGSISTPEIEAEQARDRTIQGAERAAGASSALPEASAKERAWRLATEDASIPNGTHNQICSHFWEYDQRDVLAPYAERYLEVCSQISAGTHGWNTRGHAAVDAVLTWLFPLDADEATVARVDAWLNDSNPSEQVLRTVSEQLDASVRALACQELSRQVVPPDPR